MKNSQKGFVVPLLIAIIALLVVGGVYIYKNKKVEVPAVVDTIVQQPNQVQNTSNTSSENTPVIDSITPSNGHVGTEIKIKGKNLVDAGGNQNIVIVNNKEELAYLGFGDATGSDVRDSNGKFLYWSYLKVTIGSKICKNRSTNAGLPCKAWMTILPGNYQMFIDHTNAIGHVESNRAAFTVTASGIPPSINILSPNGGEVWSQNSKYTVRWTYSGLNINDEIDIGFRLLDEAGLIDKSVCWWTEKSFVSAGYINVTPNSVSCSEGTQNLKSGGKYKVQIGASKYTSGMGVADMSDNYFTIVSN